MNHRVLIIEPNSSGHRLYYVRLLIMESVARGNEVVLATTKSAEESQEFQLHLQSVRDQAAVVFLTDFSAASIAELTLQIKPHLTVVPDGDRLAIQLARANRWVGDGQLVVLIMREVAQPSSFLGSAMLKTALRRALFKRASAISEVQVVLLKSREWRGKSRFRVARDPLTISASKSDVELIQERFSLEPERYWFAVVGAISARKNVGLIAESIANMHLDTVGLIIAGKISPEYEQDVLAAIASARRRGVQVIIKNRLLSDTELDSLIMAVDCVVLAHSNEGPSGVFAKAVSVGTSVVTGGARSLREDSKKVGNLAHWAPLRAPEFTDALVTSMNTIPGTSINTHDGVRDFTNALLGGSSEAFA